MEFAKRLKGETYELKRLMNTPASKESFAKHEAFKKSGKGLSPRAKALKKVIK